MKKNNTLMLAIGAGIAVLLSFWGGVQYGKGSTATSLTGNSFQRGTFGTQGRRGGVSSANFIMGEITNKDDKSITVKSRDGSSRFIFFSGTTQISKSTTGTTDDLLVGKEINANGTLNSDGSMTAQMIQIRPISPAQSQ